MTTIQQWCIRKTEEQIKGRLKASYNSSTKQIHILAEGYYQLKFKECKVLSVTRIDSPSTIYSTCQ